MGNVVRRVRGRGRLHADFRHIQIYLRADRRAGRLDSGPAGNIPRRSKRYFLAACVLYLSYVASAILAKPDWLLAARDTVIPTMHFEGGYLLMLTALIGTTIAPWQFFYMQASFVEKRVSARQYAQARVDVLVGSVSCMVIVFFIIVCTGATLLRFRPSRHQ